MSANGSIALQSSAASVSDGNAYEKAGGSDREDPQTPDYEVRSCSIVTKRSRLIAITRPDDGKSSSRATRCTDRADWRGNALTSLN